MTRAKQYKQLGAALIEVSMQIHDRRDARVVSIKRKDGIWYVTSKEK